MDNVQDKILHPTDTTKITTLKDLVLESTSKNFYSKDTLGILVISARVIRTNEDDVVWAVIDEEDYLDVFNAKFYSLSLDNQTH